MKLSRLSCQRNPSSRCGRLPRECRRGQRQATRYRERYRSVVTKAVVPALTDAQLVRVLAAVDRAAVHAVWWFGRLGAANISEKSPGEVVSVADGECEQLLREELTSILPGSVVVGEEGVAEDPDQLRLLAGETPVWIVDPIDGTESFVTGLPRFSVLVTLVVSGVPQASWTVAPLLSLTATAVRGGGAFVNGEPVAVQHGDWVLDGLDVMVPERRWWNHETRRRLDRLFRSRVSPASFDHAGLLYVELAAGRRTAAVLPWELPWDHAAGQLLHAEAGGVVLDMAGRSFDFTAPNALPLVAAPDHATAMLLINALDLDGTSPGGGPPGNQQATSAPA